MVYFDAVKIADSKRALIGKKVKGATLDEIIIAPICKTDFEAFQRLYIQTLDAQLSVMPFRDNGVTVMGVYDKSKIRQIGAVIFSDLSEFDE